MRKAIPTYQSVCVCLCVWEWMFPFISVYVWLYVGGTHAPLLMREYGKLHPEREANQAMAHNFNTHPSHSFGGGAVKNIAAYDSVHLSAWTRGKPDFFRLFVSRLVRVFKMYSTSARLDVYPMFGIRFTINCLCLLKGSCRLHRRNYCGMSALFVFRLFCGYLHV